MIICAGRNETFAFAHPIGVGLIESAINLTRMCLFDKPDYLLFVGSAGSYGNYKVFDIVESKRASNIELGFLTQSAYTNEKLCKEFNEYGVGIENMEFFSILSVAKEFEIPVAGIFVITNYTNENAHEDFIKNHKEAMEKLTKYLLEKNIIK